MKKTMKILGGSLLVALMSISLATKINVREVKHLEVRDLLTEDMTKPVTGKVVKRAANEEAANKISAVKAQIADTAEGKRHIRFVVGLDSVNYADAKFNIVAKDGDNVVKTFADQPVTTAYTHIEAAGVVQSAAQAFGAGYNYLMAFTIKNVPESAWNYSFEVTSSVRTEEAAEWTTTKVAKKVITEIAAADEEISAPIFNLSGIVDGGEGDAYLEANAGKNFVRYIEGVYTGYHLDETTKDLSIGIENPNSNGIWYGYQLFAVPTGIEIGTEYHISFTLNSSVAGRIQVHQKVYNIEVGDNLIEYSAVYTGGTGVNTAPFSLIFAAYDSTNEEVLVMQNANYVIKGFTMTKVVVETPDVPEGDETRNFVTMNTMFGEEPLAGNADNVGRHILYWNDQDWCGSIVNVTASVENEVATYEVASNNGGCWYGFQLFATPTERVSVVSFTLNSSVAGKIKVNGTYVDIVVGDNEISMPAFTQTAGLSIQFGEDGNQANNAIVQNATYKVSNLVFGVNTPVTPDPDPTPDPEPEPEVPVQDSRYTVVANTTAGAANNFTIKWTDAAYKVTQAPVKDDFKVSVGIIANMDFVTLADDQLQFNAITGAEPARNLSVVLHTEAGDYKVTLVITGGEFNSYTVEEVECTHTTVEPENPETPEEPEVPTQTAYTVEVVSIAGAGNQYRVRWTDDADAITLVPTMADFKVNVGIVANLTVSVLNPEQKFVEFNAVTGAESARTVTAKLHTNNGDKEFKFEVVGGEYQGFTVTDVECNHVVADPDTPVEMPEAPAGALGVNVSNWDPHGDGYLHFYFTTDDGLTHADVAEYKVRAIYNGVESDFVFQRIVNTNDVFLRNSTIGVAITSANYILVVEIVANNGNVYFAAFNMVNGRPA